MSPRNRRSRGRGRRDPRQRRRRLALLGALGLVVVLAVVVAFSPLLQVRGIEVDGTGRLDPEQVIEAASSLDGQNMIVADTDSAARSVSRLPWVDKVTVSREWPSTVRVRVTEFEAVGVVEGGDSEGGPAVINERGRVFLRGESPDGAVPVTASVDDTAALAAAGESLGALPPELRDRVEEVDAPSAEEITLRFAEGREVFWGSSDRADEKAEATRVVLTREGQRWNVSNPALPSVRN